MLVLLAVLIAPLGMVGAQAAAPAAAAGHCEDMSGTTKQQDDRDVPGHKAGCVLACAALPAGAASVEGSDLAPEAARPAWASAAGCGVRPEAEVPPPRAG